MYHLNDLDKELIRACTYNNLKKVKDLHARGANPTAEDDSGHNSLQISCRHNFLDIVKYLLSEGGIAIEHRNSGKNNTAAHTASLFGRPQIVEYLIEQGASNKEYRRADGTFAEAPITPALQIIQKKQRLPAGDAGKLEDYQKVVELWNKAALIRERALTRSQTPSTSGATAASAVVSLSLPADIPPPPKFKLASYPKATLSSQTASSHSSHETSDATSRVASTSSSLPSSAANAIYHTESEATVAAKAEISRKQQKKFDAIHRIPKTATLFDIINLGEESDKIDKEVRKKLEKIQEKYSLSKTELVELLLYQFNKFNDIPDPRIYKAPKTAESALHYAAQWNEYEIVAALIDAGISTHIRDHLNSTPLHAAARFECIETIELLLKDYKVNPNSINNFGETPLHTAACFGHAKAITVLMNYRADPYIENKRNFTVLHEAVAKNDSPDCLKALLKYPNIDIDYAGANGFTSLHSAARYGKEENVKLLLAKGANPFKRAQNGDTPKEIARNELNFLQQGNKHISAHERVIALLDAAERNLLSSTTLYQTWLKSKDFSYLNIAFINAVKENDLEAFNELLEIYPEVLNAKLYNKYSAIHTAASYNCIDILKQLKLVYTSRNADFPIDEIDAKMQTPLHHAVAYGNVEAVEWLLDNHADPLKQNAEGYTACHEAAKMGNDIIVEIFLCKGVNPNLSSAHDWSLLHTAAFNGRTEVIQVLMQHGADLTVTGPYGANILYAAIKGAINDIHGRGNHAEVIQLLLEKGISFPHELVAEAPHNIKKLLEQHREQQESISQLHELEASSLYQAENENIFPTANLTPLQEKLFKINLTDDGSEKPRAVSSKPGGSNPGAIYCNPADNTLWLGKMGYDNTLKNRFDESIGAVMGTRTHADLGIKLDALREKICMDLYSIFSNFIKHEYIVPETYLELLPIRDEHILINSFYKLKIQETFKQELDIQNTIYVMSKWYDNFQALNTIETMKNEIAKNTLPEAISIVHEGQTIDVSTDGLIRLLAHARVLADVDVLGVGLSNVGFIMTEKGLNWLKIDGTHAFQTYTANDVSIYHRVLQHDLRDLQCSAWKTESLMIKWANLTPRQQAIFIEELAKMLALCEDSAFIDLILFRQDKFYQLYEFTNQHIEQNFSLWLSMGFKAQREIYAAELQSYYAEHGDDITEWLRQSKQALGILEAPSASIGIATEPEPLTPTVDTISTVAYPIMSHAAGETTRLTSNLHDVFKQYYQQHHYWGNEITLFKLILPYTNFNKNLAFRALGALTGHGAETLKEFLVTQHLITAQELSNLKEHSIGNLMKRFSNLLKPEVYEQQPYFKLLKKLQDFIRHPPTNLDDIIEKCRQEHISGASVASLSATSSSSTVTESSSSSAATMFNRVHPAETSSPMTANLRFFAPPELPPKLPQIAQTQSPCPAVADSDISESVLNDKWAQLHERLAIMQQEMQLQFFNMQLQLQQDMQLRLDSQMQMLQLQLRQEMQLRQDAQLQMMQLQMSQFQQFQQQMFEQLQRLFQPPSRESSSQNAPSSNHSNFSPK